MNDVFGVRTHYWNFAESCTTEVHENKIRVKYFERKRLVQLTAQDRSIQRLKIEEGNTKHRIFPQDPPRTLSTKKKHSPRKF